MNTVGVLAGTQADIKAIQGLGLNVVDINTIPDAIKIGKHQPEIALAACMTFFKQYPGYLIVNTLLSWTLMHELAEYIDLWVLSLHDIEFLLNNTINSPEACEKAAQQLMALGVKSVFIQGKQRHDSQWLHSYWTNGSHSFWLTHRSDKSVGYQQAEEIFSAAVAASLALDYEMADALVIATMYMNQAMRLAQNEPYYGRFSETQADIPYLAPKPLYEAPAAFKRTHHLGLYPVVDSAHWVEFLLQQGVKTIQLRIKKPTVRLEAEIKHSITLAKKYQATLFINDYWELALKLDAQAVHLGQSDLDTADLEAIRRQGLLLGVSTYCHYEVARAHAINPSYVAIGPVYPTTSKALDFAAQGIDNLHRWVRTLNYPLVAIGGINLERIEEVAAAGVSGIALISAITKAPDPEVAVQQLLNACRSKTA